MYLKIPDGGWDDVGDSRLYLHRMVEHHRDGRVRPVGGEPSGAGGQDGICVSSPNLQNSL